jgi:hypothetical protein
MLELHAELRDQPVQVGSIRADSLFDARAVASRPLFATLAFDVENCQEFDGFSCFQEEITFARSLSTRTRRRILPEGDLGILSMNSK